MDEQMDGRSRAIFDDEGRFHGHRGGECGEHRTVGHHRAWCLGCQEWCYPGQPCASCERPMLEARAERAERELDKARVDNERLREALKRIRDNRMTGPTPRGLARAALSADAEPERPTREGLPLNERQMAELRAEPSRAERDEPEWPDCHTCNDTGAFWIGSNEYVCKDCPTAPGAYALVGQPPPSPRYDAEGGRPREADPQGTPSGNGDASVDGGGGGGRSQAVDAATRVRPASDVFTAEDGHPSLRMRTNREAAEVAIDAALDSGGVVTFEDWLHEREWGNAHFADWQRGRDARQRVEAALRDLLHAKQSPLFGRCPHCASHGCYTSDPDIPVGAFRCSTTGLAVVTGWSRGDIYQPLWDRARAALEDRDAQ